MRPSSTRVKRLSFVILRSVGGGWMGRKESFTHLLRTWGSDVGRVRTVPIARRPWVRWEAREGGREGRSGEKGGGIEGREKEGKGG